LDANAGIISVNICFGE